jgi:hypothetical protein
MDGMNIAFGFMRLLPLQAAQAGLAKNVPTFFCVEVSAHHLRKSSRSRTGDFLVSPDFTGVSREPIH